MDFAEKRPVRNPKLDANPVSRFLFMWVTPLLVKGSKKDLEIDDLFDRLPEDDAATLGQKLETLWENECQQAKLRDKKPSFLRTMIKFFGAKFLFYTFYFMINELIFKLSQPFLLRYMIQSFTKDAKEKRRNQSDHEWEQYLYTCALIFVTIAYALNIHQLFTGLQHIAMKGRIACNSIIYRKILRLSKTVQSENASIGKLVNLIASDSNRFDHCFFHFNMLLVGPAQVIILGYFLYMDLGVSCFAGIGIIAGVLIPFQVVVGKFSAKFRTQVARRTDERGRMMNEIILGIRIIKMYAWELPFSAVIHQLRKYEISPIRKAAYLRGTFQSLNFLGKLVISFCTFVIYVSLGNELTAEKAYFAISIYTIMVGAMAQKVPVAAAQTGEVLVAIKRIEGFLLLEELQLSSRHETKSTLNQKDILVNGYDTYKPQQAKVLLENVTARWTEERPTLQNISVNLSGNKLVMVVGPVGCGKSSLLNALISELPIKGTMQISGNLSYAAQESWVFSGTLRQNILFGSFLDQSRYNTVIRVCGLEEDLEQFPNGDMTIVGERGVSLSGGQKARIGLARALYQKADVYLMDDPLSAVDPRVSREIFEKCIKQHLDGCLRILVTHQLQYLPQADHIIAFNEQGGIMAQGNYQELVAQEINFVCLMSEKGHENNEDHTSIIAIDKKTGSTPNSKTNSGKAKIEGAKEKEKMNSGSVTPRTYWEYIRSGNSRIELISVATLIILAQLMLSFTDKLLSLWTNQVSRRNISSDPESQSGYSDDTYIAIYTGCVIGMVFLISTRSFLFFHYCMSISVNLHDKMFHGLIRAPVRFFETNPSGRIMNRFSRDLNIADEQLPMSLNDTVNIFLLMIGIMVIVSTSNYYLVIPSVLLLFVLWRIRQFFVKTARDLKRLESITKSPIFQHVTASVQGLTTIRGLGAQERVVDQFDSLLDINSSPTYLVVIGNRWFGAWMDLTCIVYLTCVAFSFFLIDNGSEGGDVGMAVSLTLNLLMTLQWGMRQSAETENCMTSVERILEYSNIQPEATSESKKKLPSDWPKTGSIRFSNVNMSYDGTNDVHVLKNLTFEIAGNEKVGIVGRTGAGKSSILVALFRLNETQGDILIDNVSIKDISLNDLRKNISIIPQDPVLFSGTMRYNLDPFDQFQDTDLWDVLKEVNLADAVSSLDVKVSDGGGNYSVGQRQLVCLARAILRKNKIIVMDEATANVDPGTDNLIQEKIRRKFADCTIITIAHRLHSVIDNDRILVLDNGCLKEFDTPANLLQNPESLFSQMVNQTGSAAEANLRKIANGLQ